MKINLLNIISSAVCKAITCRWTESNLIIFMNILDNQWERQSCLWVAIDEKKYGEKKRYSLAYIQKFAFIAHKKKTESGRGRKNCVKI